MVGSLSQVLSLITQFENGLASMLSKPRPLFYADSKTYNPVRLLYPQLINCADWPRSRSGRGRAVFP